MIKDAYLERKDVNVIVMDWSSLSHSILYFPSKWSTRRIGKHLGQFISFLVANGVDISQVHCIGHSLGAHICGYAGSSITDGWLGRITGNSEG